MFVYLFVCLFLRQGLTNAGFEELAMRTRLDLNSRRPICLLMARSKGIYYHALPKMPVYVYEYASVMLYAEKKVMGPCGVRVKGYYKPSCMVV